MKNKIVLFVLTITMSIGNINVSFAKSQNPLPEVGEVVSGFELIEKTGLEENKSQTAYFEHIQSGAHVLYIQSDDENSAFNIVYKTPYMDETDANHVLEHALTSGSTKYPSKDIFFDASNKSYITYMNAYTSQNLTGYLASSRNERQLMSILDVYMSCLYDPLIKYDRNFFKREAVRYELTSPEAPITLNGVVYNEDMGNAYSAVDEALNALYDVMYPNMYASNSIGRAFENYDKLTYEKVMTVYNTYYTPSNSLIMLYGDLDIMAFIEFLDAEYLSHFERKEVDLSRFINEQMPEGDVDGTVSIPVYGDSGENGGIVFYSFNLSHMDYISLCKLERLVPILMADGSEFKEQMDKAGFENRYSIYFDMNSYKPTLSFYITNGFESEKENFKYAVDKALNRIEERGIDKEVLDEVKKKQEFADNFSGESTNTGISLTEKLGSYWVFTDGNDYGIIPALISDTFKTGLANDEIKSIISSIKESKRKCTLAAIAEEGLAEKKEASKQRSLQNKKDSMTDDEIFKLIEETYEFYLWNDIEVNNDDFAIEPSELSDINEFPEVTEKTIDGVRYIYAPADVENIASFSVYFDSSGIPVEDIHYMTLLGMLLGELDTTSKPIEISDIDILLNSFSAVPSAYTDESTNDMKTIFGTSWYSLEDDFDDSIDLYFDIIYNTVFNENTVLEKIELYKEYYNEARSSNVLSTLINNAQSSLFDSYSYNQYAQGQSYYDFLNNIASNAYLDKEYMKEVVSRLGSVRSRIINKNNAIVTIASKNSDELCQRASEYFADMPRKTITKADLSQIPVPADYTAVIVDSGVQSIVSAASFENAGIELNGSHIVAMTMLNDKYFVPALRLGGTAYSAGGGVKMNPDIIYSYSYMDSGLLQPMSIMADFSSVNLNITEDELNGYILKAYNEVNSLMGDMAAADYSITNYIKNVDINKYSRLAEEIKDTNLESVKKALNDLKKVDDNIVICIFGSESAIMSNSNIFGLILDYR